MAIHTQESLSGFIASDPHLSFTERGDARLFVKIGQEHYRREDDGSFTQTWRPPSTTSSRPGRTAERADQRLAKGDKFLGEGYTHRYDRTDEIDERRLRSSSPRRSATTSPAPATPSTARPAPPPRRPPTASKTNRCPPATPHRRCDRDRKVTPGHERRQPERASSRRSRMSRMSSMRATTSTPAKSPRTTSQTGHRIRSTGTPHRRRRRRGMARPEQVGPLAAPHLRPPVAVIPPFWHRHPELVWELSALHLHWLCAYDPEAKRHRTPRLAPRVHRSSRASPALDRRVRHTAGRPTVPPARSPGQAKKTRTPSRTSPSRTGRRTSSPTCTPTSKPDAPSRMRSMLSSSREGAVLGRRCRLAQFKRLALRNPALASVGSWGLEWCSALQ